MKRSRRLRLETRISPVLVALLLAWSVDGAFAEPGPPAAESQDAEGGATAYLVLGAVAAGFAATYALLLGGNERSYSRNTATAPDGGATGSATQTPGGAETPGGGETSGGSETTGGAEVPPTAGHVDPISAPAATQTPTAEAPEPGMWLLLGSGAAALLAARSRRPR